MSNHAHESSTQVVQTPARSLGLPWALSLLMTSTFALACDEQPISQQTERLVTPAQVPMSAVPSESARALEPAATPEPALSSVELEEVARACDIAFEGDEKILRAFLNTRSQGIVEIEVDGRKLQITCPEDESDHEAARVIVELESSDGVKSVVHWDVDLDPNSAIEDLSIATSKPGVGELNEDDLDQLQAEWPESAQWANEEANEPAVEEAAALKPKNVTKAVAKVEVEINAGRLKWAELRYESEKTKRKKRVTLAAKATPELEPGTYTLSVRYPEGSSEWQDAGTLEVEEGKTNMYVKLKEGPLRAQIISSQ